MSLKEECDLKLISSVSDVTDIPKAGKSLVIVAAVKNVLHFRIFDFTGRVIADTDETKLGRQAQQIENLRKQLDSLWLSHELTKSEKERVVATVTSIIGDIPVDTPMVNTLELRWSRRAVRCRTQRQASAMVV